MAALAQSFGMRILAHDPYACARHPKAAGFMVKSAEEGRQLLSQGFRILAYRGDIWIYRQALREGITALRGAAPGVSPP